MFAALVTFAALISIVFAPIAGRDVYEQDAVSFDSQNRPLWDSLCSALGMGSIGCDALPFDVQNAGRLELVAFLCSRGVAVADGESTGALRMAALMECPLVSPSIGVPAIA